MPAPENTERRPRTASRPSLSTMRRPKPGSDAPEATLEETKRRNGKQKGKPETEVASETEDVRAMTLRLPRELMKSLKLVSINEERSVSDIIRDAVRQYLRSTGGTKAKA